MTLGRRCLLPQSMYRVGMMQFQKIAAPPGWRGNVGEEKRMATCICQYKTCQMMSTECVWPSHLEPQADELLNRCDIGLSTKADAGAWTCNLCTLEREAKKLLPCISNKNYLMHKVVIHSTETILTPALHE